MRAERDRHQIFARRVVIAVVALAWPAAAPAQDSELADWQQNRRVRYAEFRAANPTQGVTKAPAVIMDDAFAPRMVVVPGKQSAAAARPPAIGMFPIVYGEYATFVAQTGHRSAARCRAPDGSAIAGDRDWRAPGFTQSMIHPATCIAVADAEAYAAWLSKLTGRRYRLLSRAEHDHAAAGAAAVPAGGTGTAPVNASKPNAFGLYDMPGNVLSWTRDCGAGARRCGSPTLTGRSWARAQAPQVPPGYAATDTGFRVAREP